MKKSALVIEGGGMRGIYTAGVLDGFIEMNLYFPYVIGVSAGAIAASSYISKQKERTKKVILNYVNDPRYMGIRNLLKEGNIFSTDFAYNEIPYKLLPFQFDEFFNSDIVFKIGVTDCKTGKSKFFEKSECKENIMDVIRASGSLPFLSKMVDIKGNPYLDGGVADSIPVKVALNDGNEKIVAILTRTKGYRKKRSKLTKTAFLKYRHHKEFAEALVNRYKNYNESLEYLEKLEKEGKAIIIRPNVDLKIKRLEKDTERLEALYNKGYSDAKEIYGRVVEFLK